MTIKVQRNCAFFAIIGLFSPRAEKGECLTKKRYVQVGTGGRAKFFYDALTKDYTETDPLNRAASYEDGAMSILTGIAANKSIATGMPVNIKDLVEL